MRTHRSERTIRRLLVAALLLMAAALGCAVVPTLNPAAGDSGASAHLSDAARWKPWASWSRHRSEPSAPSSSGAPPPATPAAPADPATTSADDASPAPAPPVQNIQPPTAVPGAGGPATSVPTTTGKGLRLGTTIFAMWRDWDQVDTLLDETKASGSPWLRVDMGWCSLEEAGAGKISTWYQDRLDHVVDGARQRGLQLLLEVSCTPSWQSAKQMFPTDVSQYQRVMRYLAARYKGQVAAWEIWNEPDCIGGCPNGSPAAYVPVLQAGYRGVKAGDPAALVVSGGISGNNVDWLRRMYAAGAQGYFDVLATHPYLNPVTGAPTLPSQGQIYRMTTVADVHALMQQNGDGNKQIFFTEWGWTTARTGDRPGVDEATQSQYLQQSVQMLRQQYPYVSAAFWFCMRDRDDSTPYENEFGLLHVNGSPKPAYAGLQAANRWLAAQN